MKEPSLREGRSPLCHAIAGRRRAWTTASTAPGVQELSPDPRTLHNADRHGELFNSLWDCVPLIKEQWIDYIRCDLGHIGGIRAARKPAALAELFQVKAGWHGPGDIAPPIHAANVHVDISIPNFGIQEMVFFPEVTR